MPTLDEIIGRILSLPREAGTPEATQARDLVAAYLRDLGYTVTYQKFTFAPSSLKAFPILGAGLGWLALVLLPLLVSGAAPAWAALMLWAVGLAALLAVAMGVGLGWVQLGEGLREDANLIATRGPDEPDRWVVAHLDSKAQGQSMAGRLAAVWVVGLAIAFYSALALLRPRSELPIALAAAGSVVAIVAGFLAGRGRLKGSSLGARDNGTGVVAALSAAATPDARIGILITGAEEFGLVGARVYARLASNLGAAEFVNVDTVDQEGKLYFVSHDGRGERLAVALESRLSGLGPPTQRRRLPLGIFVDSAPLARSGGTAVTIGRLTWRTLRCIHTAADTPDGLSFETARRVGTAIAQSN